MSIDEIRLTHTTRSKEFRYHTANEIRRMVRERDGELYYIENTDGNIFHLLTEDDIVLVLRREKDAIVVVTQMSRHGRVYPENDMRQVDDFDLN